MINDDIRLGRLAGVPLAINWSVLVIILLLTWGLSESVLPDVAPGHPAATYWLAGAVGALVFIGSLLAHEMAHAVVARRAGMRVKGMTLWLFGGIAKLDGQPPDARADLRIAAAGPATSIGLAAGFAAVAVVLDGLGIPHIAVALAAWLGAVNLILAVFNLIPGAPLDGGRILRALLWRRHGDWVRAAVSATRAGQVVGYGLIWIGLAQFILGYGIGGLWMVFIGWFVLLASRAEQDHVLTASVLHGVRVGDVMTPSPQIAPGRITVTDLIENYLLGRAHSAYPVEDAHGRIEGLVTLRQLRDVRPDHRATTRVAEVALPIAEVPTAGPDDPVGPLLLAAAGPSGGRVLVFDQQRLVGLVTPTDINRAIDARSLAANPMPTPHEPRHGPTPDPPRQAAPHR